MLAESREEQAGSPTGVQQGELHGVRGSRTDEQAGRKWVSQPNYVLVPCLLLRQRVIIGILLFSAASWCAASLSTVAPCELET